MVFRLLAMCIDSNNCLLLKHLCTALLEVEKKKRVDGDYTQKYHDGLPLYGSRGTTAHAPTTSFECNPLQKIERELTSGFGSVFCTV